MQHAHAKVPKTNPPVFSDTAEPVIPLIAAPGIERDRGHPRMMALAASDESRAFGGAPYGDDVVLATGHDVFAVGRPADARQPAIVGVVKIEEPNSEDMLVDSGFS